MLIFLKFAGGVATLYLIVVVLIALLQDKLLFPRWAMRAGAPLPATAERLVVGVGSDEQLVGVRLPPEGQRSEARSLVLAFGGNAWNANDLAVHLHSIFAGRDIVAFHYRGYPPSSGGPSARAILDDAVRIHDEIVSLLTPDRIIAVGLSVGAGPAAHLAKSRPIDGLILVTPFDSLGDLARAHYPWLPVGVLLRHRMDVASDLMSVLAPVALIAAADDTIVPPSRTDGVRRSVRNLIADRVITNASHNDIYDRIEYRRAMQEALSLIEAGGEAP